MIGLSTFFTTAFSNLFIAQEKAQNTQNQFVINEIIRDKFMNLDSVIDLETDSVIVYNDNSEGNLPFTYIGESIVNEGQPDEERYLAFKDLFVFNGVLGNLYLNTGTGTMVHPVSSQNITGLNGPSGLIDIPGSPTNYYITEPQTNRIRVCQLATDCPQTSLALEEGGETYELDTPTDIDTDDSFLYVTDSGNGRVLKIDPGDGETTIVAENLDFPTGISYYSPTASPSDEYLFVSETFANRVLRFDLNDLPAGPTVVAGMGDSKACNNSARYCQLTLPTGVYADSGDNELYIADSGNDRILLVTDPLNATGTLNIAFKFVTPGAPTKISRIDFTFPSGTVNVVKDAGSATPLEIDSANHNYTSSPTFSYLLSADFPDTGLVNVCAGEGCYTRNKIDVSANAAIFNVGDAVKINDDAGNLFTITAKNGSVITVSPNFTGPGEGSQYSAGGTIKLAKTFNPATEIIIPLEVTPNAVTDPFEIVHITVYDEDDTIMFEQDLSMRIGDGILGSVEDTIIDVEEMTPAISPSIDPQFTTGVSKSSVLTYSNGFNQVARIFGGDQPIEILSETDISDFDFTSDFEINSVDFASRNSGYLLEMTIDTQVTEEDNQIYKLNASVNPN